MPWSRLWFIPWLACNVFNPFRIFCLAHGQLPLLQAQPASLLTSPAASSPASLPVSLLHLSLHPLLFCFPESSFFLQCPTSYSLPQLIGHQLLYWQVMLTGDSLTQTPYVGVYQQSISWLPLVTLVTCSFSTGYEYFAALRYGFYSR